jgi:hypothetical protein
MQTEARAQEEGSEVVSWRRDQLVRSGFLLPEASRAARDMRFDVHALIGLVERGCPELAIRILAPIDANGHAA